MTRESLKTAGTAFLYAAVAASVLAFASLFLITVAPVSWFEGPLLIVGLVAWFSGPLLIFASILATFGAILLGCGR